MRVGGYAYRILTANLLEISQYGILSLALPIQSGLLLVTSGGVAPSVAKYIAEGKDVLKSSFVFFTLASSVITIFLIILVFLFSPFGEEARIPLIIASLAIPFGVLISVLTGNFQGERKYGRMCFVLSFEQVMRIILALLLIGLGATGAILGSTLGFVVSLFLAFILMPFRPSFGKEYKEVVLFSIPASLTAIGAFLLYNIDTLCLGWLDTYRNVGLYNAASPTARIVIGISVAASASLLPLMASSDQKEIYWRQSQRFTTFFLFPATGILISMPEWILKLLFKDEFVLAKNSLIILAVGMFFFALYTLSTSVFQGLGMPSIPMYILLVSAILDIILNVILIPIYHINGASMSTSISCVYAFFMSILFLRSFGFKFEIKIILRAFFAVLIPLFLWYHLQGFLGLLLGFLLYTSSFVLIKGVTKDEIDLLLKWLRA